MAFQHEPDHVAKPTRCDRCHEPVMVELAKLTSDSEPYCSHCGYVFGTSVAPASWVCESCSEIVLDHGGDERPWCEDCKLPMSCARATASGVHGAGTGITELDHGLALLMKAQQGCAATAKAMVKRRNDMLALGGDILNDMLGA